MPVTELAPRGDTSQDGHAVAVASLEERGERNGRETWNKKLDFLLSVIGFAVDLGNVWRFPYICYKNGGGAFLIPYLVMLFFGGLPLFFLELALGQFQRCGCISVWRKICPMFTGIGFGICFINSYVAFYYNTIIAWAFYYLFSSMTTTLPWGNCDNDWNTANCTTFEDRANANATVDFNYTTTSSYEFFYLEVLQRHKSGGIGSVGTVKWSLALCLMAVFVIVYFSLWKGIKSSGKVVWITATLPYVVLLILLIRGVTLEGAAGGIIYYLKPNWERLKDSEVWKDAAAQIFFSLGPGFGVLLALSSYNKFHNNCYRDALITSSINCLTSFLAGFVVFSVLGYMSFKENKPIEEVAVAGPGLVFVVYPEAIATLPGSVAFSIIFFLMLITLGLDSTFGGLESIITGVLDAWPALFGKRREMFVVGLLIYCFLGGLATTTYGGYYVFNLLDQHAAPISILFIVFVEAVAVNWFYGVNRFSSDVEQMLGHKPGIYWRVCWLVISPTFLLTLFIVSVVTYKPLTYDDKTEFPSWAVAIGWIIACTSLFCVPLYMIYSFFMQKGSITQRFKSMIKPEDKTPNDDGYNTVYL